MPQRINRKTGRPAAFHGQGQTQAVQGERQQPVPRTPNEHDESADSQAGQEPSSRRIGGAARDSLARGQVDTDKGPVLDATYRRVRGDGKPR